MSLVVRKLVFAVSDQIRHKPSCTATEDSKRHEISKREVEEGFYYPCSENKGADYREADLCLCFRICKKPVSS